MIDVTRVPSTISGADFTKALIAHDSSKLDPLKERVLGHLRSGDYKRIAETLSLVGHHANTNVEAGLPFVLQLEASDIAKVQDALIGQITSVGVGTSGVNGAAVYAGSLVKLIEKGIIKTPIDVGNDLLKPVLVAMAQSSKQQLFGFGETAALLGFTTSQAFRLEPLLKEQGLAGFEKLAAREEAVARGHSIATADTGRPVPNLGREAFSPSQLAVRFGRVPPNAMISAAGFAKALIAHDSSKLDRLKERVLGHLCSGGYEHLTETLSFVGNHADANVEAGLPFVLQLEASDIAKVQDALIGQITSVGVGTSGVNGAAVYAESLVKLIEKGIIKTPIDVGNDLLKPVLVAMAQSSKRQSFGFEETAALLGCTTSQAFKLEPLVKEHGLAGFEKLAAQ